MDIIEQLRDATDAVIKSGVTRYAIAKGARVDYAALMAWLDNGSDIRISTAAKLASFLNLELRPIDQTAKDKAKVKAPAVPAVDWSTAEPKRKPKRDR
jgi:hypothetical protein